MKHAKHTPPAIPGIPPGDHASAPLSTVAGACGSMSQCSYTLLRHILIQGPSTVADLCKLEATTPRATIVKALGNLYRQGFLAIDTSNKDAPHILTTKAKNKLADPFDVQPKNSPGQKLQEKIKAQHAVQPASQPAGQKPGQYPSKWDGKVNIAAYPTRPGPAKGDATSTPPIKATARQLDMRASTYRPTEYAPSTRPGAHAAYTLPSRVGQRLHHPDGRVTDMAGNPIKTIQA